MFNEGYQGGKCSVFFLYIFVNGTSRKAQVVLQCDNLSSYFFHNRKKTCHKGTEGDQWYTSALSLTSALMRMGGYATNRPLYRRDVRYPFYRGWVGSKSGVDGCGKSRPPQALNSRTQKGSKTVKMKTRPFRIICKKNMHKALTFVKEMGWLSPTHGSRSQREDCTHGRHLETGVDISWTTSL